jgi:hypothetical protein
MTSSEKVKNEQKSGGGSGGGETSLYKFHSIWGLIGVGIRRTEKGEFRGEGGVEWFSPLAH